MAADLLLQLTVEVPVTFERGRISIRRRRLKESVTRNLARNC
jgi:hypothetical protein